MTFAAAYFVSSSAARADGYDGIGANGYGAVVEDAALSVHGDYRAAGYQQVYFFLRER